MKRPVFWPIVATVITAGLVFTFGNVTNNAFLELRIGPGNMEITFAPILIGLVAGFVTERILIRKQRESSNVSVNR